MSEKRTPEEIEKLKADWAKDPIWDIENTEGFEAHYGELFDWRKEYEAKMEAKWLEAENERIENVMLATGVGKSDRAMLLSLRTWKELEDEARDAERYTEDPQVSIAATQVRATLLQAAQLKRIADALESMADGDTLSNSLKIYGSE